MSSAKPNALFGCAKSIAADPQGGGMPSQIPRENENTRSAGCGDFTFKVLLITEEESPTFWKLSSDELHASTRMWQVVEALDPYKEWDLPELALEQQGQVLGRSGVNL